MDKIQKVSSDVKSAIQRKSAYTLPNNPTDSGWTANDIKKAFWRPVIDNANSAITEIDRVVDEINGYLNYAVKDLDNIVKVTGIYYHSSTGLVYILGNGKFTVSGYESEEANIKIPTHIYYGGNYVEIVGIEEEAFKGKGIKNVEIPETIAKIGNRAFASCMKLATVIFKGNTEIGSDVFASKNTVYGVPKEYLTAYKSLLAGYVLDVEDQICGTNTIESNFQAIQTVQKAIDEHKAGECAAVNSAEKAAAAAASSATAAANSANAASSMASSAASSANAAEKAAEKAEEHSKSALNILFGNHGQPTFYLKDGHLFVRIIKGSVNPYRIENGRLIMTIVKEVV